MIKVLGFLLFLLNVVAFDGLEIVTSTKKIHLEKYPGAFNPSLIQTELGLLLSFRYCPDVIHATHISYIGIVVLDADLNLISEPELLNTRQKESTTPSQSEDARLFKYRDRIFVIYNDNIDIVAPSYWKRRDMFIAELFYSDGHFTLSPPLKLIHEGKYHQQHMQKNWVPFELDKTLMIAYSVNPHEILYPNFATGSCYQAYESWAPISWEFGTLRLSAPPLLVDGEFLAFFHSGKVLSSPASNNQNLWHYFMGAYTFSTEPPHKIQKITPLPIIDDEFYTQSGYEKRVIFPGGFVVSDNTIHVAYGKDDCEIWIATLDKTVLKNSMIALRN